MELQEIKNRTDEGQRLRGWITNAYAQIEYILGDIIVRSLDMDEYKGIGEVLPHGAPDRIKRVRRILEVQGPYSDYKAELGIVLTDFERHHENRNLLAHGFCTVYHTPEDDFGLEFRKWHRVPGRQDAELIRTFRLKDLEYHEAQLVHLSQNALELLSRIHQHLDVKNDRR